MKALFYLLDGDSNASSYHRVLQYFPLLRRHGIEPVAARPVPEPVYRRLVERGDGGMAAKVGFYGLFAANRAIQVLQASAADVVVIQRDLFPFGPPLLERALAQRNPRLVYDTDDATYLRPSFTPNTPFQRLRRFDKVAEVVRRARWVTVATEPIAEWVRECNPNVTVVPMAIDPRVYDRVRRERAEERTVLGWAGTAGGLRYLNGLARVLAGLARQDVVVRVVSGGYRQVQVGGIAVEALPWHGVQQLAAFDIGLLPLEDSSFERAKFPFKLLQYWALGIPVVASRVGTAAQVIEHEHNGLLVRSDEEWRDALSRLIRDPDERERLGAAGRETVLSGYTIERIGPLLVDGLLAAAR